MLLASLILASKLVAAGAVPPQDEPLRSSSYVIDLFQGPVLAGSRPTGLGGAFAAVAQGVDGDQVNPAAPAVRLPWSVDWFDYDLTAGVTFANALRETDFDNNGKTGFFYDQFLFGTLGLNLQFGGWGFGAVLDTQNYEVQGLSPADARQTLNASLQRGHVLLSRRFQDGQLMLGAGVRFALLSLSANDGPGGKANELFKTSGATPEVGAIWTPYSLPLRLAVAARTEVFSETDPTSQTVADAEGNIVVGQLYLPRHVVLPWEIEVGAAYQLGARPLNVPWVNPREENAPLAKEIDEARASRAEAPLSDAEERAARTAEDRRLKTGADQTRAARMARARALARQKLLVTASVLISGPVRDAVGVQSFLQQVTDRSGERVVLTPRLGLEFEPADGWVQLRAGTYLEPTRFREGATRLHGTFGFDLRLFQWSAFGLFDDQTYWRVGGVIDGAREYLGWGLAAGAWH
ncbi:MAG: hypothetical protein ACYC8T_14465 [Myxococcaceae bacterium]